MIEIKRGTTEEFVIDLENESGERYVIGDGDTLVFGVKKSAKQDYYNLSKTITADSYSEAKGGHVVSIAPSDTQDLSFGSYVYDVGLQTSSGDFYIVCPFDTFVIADTVTKKV